MRSDGWHLTHDLDDFLTRAHTHMRAEPSLHTVQLTVTENLRTRGLHIYGDGAPEFGVLERGGKVRASLFRTPPFWLNLTRLTGEEADALAALLVEQGRPLPGVNADPGTAAAFAEAWQRRTGATAMLRARQRLYRLGTLTAPEPAPPGRPRIAGEADRAQLLCWHKEFSEAVGPGAGRDSAEWADDRIARGDLTLWETPDGTPVAMAGLTPKVAGQIRVNAVYTPPHQRGRGYAGAVTAEVSRGAREDAGAEEVVLFTDLANPTSNRLYQRLGYRPVTDFALYTFTPAGSGTGSGAGSGPQ
ncbi:GNAT family N-acetyltransferase [Streptomyces sp. TRM68367]|uniref:GNAT family N-acetyltransferase n=1 Tax=Streptomyces sp. TRM68367 TaxID=2758415 RepID=UPI00165C6424|nr:GNAT family N-acetyltransferase [Streptomyces sp. TRM68367]MBC9730111.1 GNAT family N-acetyltransferase [Streptomyces sp. TRM68367]